MDWALSIERNRAILVDIVLALFAEIGLTRGGMIERLARPLHLTVLRELRTAEAAVRRLIYVAARDLVVEPPPERAAPAARDSSDKKKAESKAAIESNGQGNDQVRLRRRRRPSFNLFETPREFQGFFGRRKPKTPRIEPRIRVIDFDPRIPAFLRPQAQVPAPAPEPEVPVDDGTVAAVRLCRRLFAALAALEDIPRQAMRRARWRSLPVEERRPPRESPLRSGRPPGWRQRNLYEVDAILKECHWLARNVQPLLDTS